MWGGEEAHTLLSLPLKGTRREGSKAICSYSEASQECENPFPLDTMSCRMVCLSSYKAACPLSLFLSSSCLWEL
jgi:hypothetical protein